ARTGSEDIDWAIDYCRRMVLAVEERYYQQTNSPAQTMEIQASLSECRARCLALLEQMKTLYSGKCSPSIETALHYIHEH
ncbi:MAG: DNA-binding response regulator, partial [Pseudoflavonifractor sp.]